MFDSLVVGGLSGLGKGLQVACNCFVDTIFLFIFPFACFWVSLLLGGSLLDFECMVLKLNMGAAVEWSY